MPLYGLPGIPRGATVAASAVSLLLSSIGSMSRGLPRDSLLGRSFRSVVREIRPSHVLGSECMLDAMTPVSASFRVTHARVCVSL